MCGLAVYCKRTSGSCRGCFLKHIPLVTVIDMKWCVFQHLIGSLIHFQCSALCDSEITFTLAVYRKMWTLGTVCHSYTNNSWKLLHSGLKKMMTHETTLFSHHSMPWTDIKSCVVCVWEMLLKQGGSWSMHSSIDLSDTGNRKK